MSEFKSSDSPVTHPSLTITSSQIKFEGLEQLRIAKLRHQQRRQPKQSEVLIGPPVAPRRNRKPRPEPRKSKSKRIGKVVIKLRNGKKLVVKKKRKQSNGQRSKTTQRPVLVTTKAVLPSKPRLSFPSSVSLPPIRVSTPAPAPAAATAQKTENIFQRFNSIPIGKRYCVVKPEYNG